MLRWGSVILVVLCAQPAAAGPWVRQDDGFYSRFAVSRASIEALDAYRMDAYAEYGLSDAWTATFKYERLQFDDFGEFDSDGWRITARRGFRLTDTIVASLESGVLEGEAIGGAAGCESFGAELRSGLGQSLQFGKKRKRNAFWFAEAAVRAHTDGCMRRRLELGYGQQAFRNVWAISQAWFDVGDENASSSKYQFEYMWRTRMADLSLGTVSELGGNFQETSVFFALARQF